MTRKGWHPEGSIARRFWTKVDRISELPCWIWKGASSSGHGHFRADHRLFTAPQAAVILVRGDLEPGMQCHHRCSNSLCVNPDHLELVFQPTIRTKKQFERQVEVSDSGCWLWHGLSPESGRYGTTSIKGKQIQAHRLAWELFREAIPEGMFCLHHCDNPSCVNPDHLYIGDYRDNMLDALRRGRCPWTHLTLNNVRAIRRLYASGEHRYVDLGEMFDIDPTAIGKIVRRVTWKFVQD